MVRFLEITRKKVHFNNVVLTETKFFLENFSEILKEANSRTLFGFYDQPYSGWAFSGLLAPHRKYLSHISYIDETWHTYTLPKENPKKYINQVTHHLSSPDISIFSLKISNF